MVLCRFQSFLCSYNMKIRDFPTDKYCIEVSTEDDAYKLKMYTCDKNNVFFSYDLLHNIEVKNKKKYTFM